jgi:2-isopropylmalate synthase
MSERIYIFDTTLRDGEQAPGASMNVEEKIIVARQMERLGVDIIEAGFPAASEGDFEAVRKISCELTTSQACALSRTRKEDIERGLKALEGAKHPRLHIFIATSDIHLEYKLKMSREQVVESAVKAIQMAKKYLDNIEFSCEDATRSSPEFMVKIIGEVIEAGATTINIPDTVGYALPFEFEKLLRHIKEKTAGIDKIILSVHCHDDLGLAVANSLAGVSGGARQVECTINGIGERAGNAAMEEIVMAIHTRKELLAFNTGIVTEQIYPTSRLVRKITGIQVPPNKAVVGANAFSHEAGIHQAGVIENPLTYEIMTPENVGIPSGRLVMGKHSGRHAFRPVDATFKTISKLTGARNKLLLFSVNAITSGTDAQGEVRVRIEEEGIEVSGFGAHTDVIVASALAYIDALNHLEFKKQNLSAFKRGTP